jgi:CheY-like chemotaxis protein/nitrogen-specific signal transduction histidine kinase
MKYIVFPLIALGPILYVTTRKVMKYKEYILLMYLILILSLLLLAKRSMIPRVTEREAFWMGYGLAMVIRLVGYRIISFPSMIGFYIVTTCLKFPLIHNPEPALNVIVIALDLITLFVSYKSEKVERSLFDALYKSKKHILKFKLLLTKYLPNEMVIFSKNYSKVLYVNNAFRDTFKVKNAFEIKETLKRYVIEKETIEKKKVIFKTLGFEVPEEDETVSLSSFVEFVSTNQTVFHEIGLFNFPVIENEQPFHQTNASVPFNPREENSELFEKSLEPSRLNQKKSQASSLRKRTLEDNFKNVASKAFESQESYHPHEKGSQSSSSEEGMKKAFKVKMFPLLWDDDEAIAMIMDDITRQKIITELKMADRNKDLVIAMVSHDLRTPLNGMLGLVDIAMKNIRDTATLAYLEACKNSGGLMLNFVNSILDLHQIKDNKLNLIYSKISLSALLTEIRALFAQVCKVKQLYLNIEVDPTVSRSLATDKSRLTQVLINLLGNAFKFTFYGGVTIKVDPENEDPSQIKFSVVDTGIGIKKEDQDKLFKMYGKLEQKDKKINTNGVGLGLTISNTLATLLSPHGNQPIKIESELNKGTCFSFVVQSKINLVEDNKETNQSSVNQTSSILFDEAQNEDIFAKLSFYSKPYERISKIDFSLDRNPTAQTVLLDKAGGEIKEKPKVQKKKIISPVKKSQSDDDLLNSERPLLPSQPWCLVVDDNPFNLMVASHIMSERGYQVKTAMNGQDAVEKAIEDNRNGISYKLVLMDCQMPVMDGYEATRILKNKMENDELRSCPVIALTANNRSEQHENLCKKAGMDGHVSKPLQISELESVLKKVMIS